MFHCILLRGYAGNMQTWTDLFGILKISSTDPVVVFATTFALTASEAIIFAISMYDLI